MKKQLAAWVPEELHERVRVAAFNERISMSRYTERALNFYLSLDQSVMRAMFEELYGSDSAGGLCAVDFLPHEAKAKVNKAVIAWDEAFEDEC